MKKDFAQNLRLVVAAAFCALAVGTLTFDQRACDSYVAEAAARNIYYLATPTVTPASGKIALEHKRAQATAGNLISGSANENAPAILSPQAEQFLAGGGSALPATEWAAVVFRSG